MTDDQTPHPDLRTLIEPLRDEFPAELVPPAGAIDRDQLFVQLPEDEEGRARRLELIFLPDRDGVFFLQYFVPLPYEIRPDRFGDLARLMARINARLPLIGFCLLEELPLACFRCVAPCPDRPLDGEIVVNTAYVALYIVDRFGSIVESLGNGSATLEECHARISQDGF